MESASVKATATAEIETLVEAVHLAIIVYPVTTTFRATTSFLATFQVTKVRATRAQVAMFLVAIYSAVQGRAVTRVLEPEVTRLVA